MKPLTPPECDLRDFAYMPLEVSQLRDSTLAALSTGDEFKAATLLWAFSWHQVPAASLPQDPRLLAHHSGAGHNWAAVEKMALHGWHLCEDGRLYHPVIAKRANEAWHSKKEQRARTLKARIAAMHKRVAESNDEGERAHLQGMLSKLQGSLSQAFSEVSDPVCDRVSDTQHSPLVTATKRKEGKEKGEGKERDTVPSPSAPEPQTSTPIALPAAKELRPDPASNDRGQGASEIWNAYSHAYQDRYGVPPVRNAKTNAQLKQLKSRIDSDEAPHVAAHYLLSDSAFYVNSKHPVDLLLRDAEKLRTEWATRSHSTLTQARQADKAAANGNVFDKLISEVRDGTR